MERYGRSSRPRSDNYGSAARSRDKAADSLWGQSASQRAGVATSLDKPSSLFSRQSYDAERERKRQLISKMVTMTPHPTHTVLIAARLCMQSGSDACLLQGGDKGEGRGAPLRVIAPTNTDRDRRADAAASSYSTGTGTPSWSQRPRSAALISSRFEAGAASHVICVLSSS